MKKTIFLFFLIFGHAMADLPLSHQKVMVAIKNYSQQVEKETGILLKDCSFNSCKPVYGEKIEDIHLNYVLEQRMQEKEADHLFYKILDKLIEKINQDTDLVKEFSSKTIGYKNVWCHLSFCEGDESHLKKGEVIRMGIFDNQLYHEIAKGEDAVLDDKSRENVTKIIDEYSEFIKREKRVYPTSYGLDYNGKIHQIDLSYRFDQRMEIEEASDFFYDLVDDLLNKINNNRHLKEYFNHFPIGYEDLKFSLAFDYEEKGFLKAGDTSSIYIRDNKIYYTLVENKQVVATKTNPIDSDAFIIRASSSAGKTIRSDFLEKKIRSKKSSPPNKKDLSYIQVVKDLDAYSDFINEKYAAKREHYEIIYAHKDRPFDGKIHGISLRYRIDKKMQLNEAKKFYSEIVKTLIEKINSNKSTSQDFYHSPIGYEDLSFFVFFDDPETQSSLKKGDIASIGIFENQICYTIVEKEWDSVKMKSPDLKSDFVIDFYNTRNRSIVQSLKQQEKDESS